MMVRRYDYAVKTAEPIQTHAQRAARWAVFTPLFGPRWRFQELHDVLARLRKLWHRRLDTLQEVGWSPSGNSAAFAADKRLQYVRNCPPFSVDLKDYGQTCNMPKLCPFCYARRFVIQPMQWLETILFKSSPQLSRVRDLILVDFTTSIRFTRRDLNWMTRRASRGEVFESIAATLQAGKKREVDSVNHVGGVTLQRVEFDDDGWTLLRSGVFICNGADYELQNFRPATCETVRKRVSPPTRKHLARAVARAFRYPANLLVTAPEIVKEYSDLMHRRRLVERYGLLRGEMELFKSAFETDD